MSEYAPERRLQSGRHKAGPKPDLLIFATWDGTLFADCPQCHLTVLRSDGDPWPRLTELSLAARMHTCEA